LSPNSSHPQSHVGSLHCLMQRQQPLTQVLLGPHPDPHGVQAPLHGVA